MNSKFHELGSKSGRQKIFENKNFVSLTIDCLYLYFGMRAEIFATRNFVGASICEKREYYWP